MILLVNDLKKRYRSYSNVKSKVSREVKNGTLIKLKKGVYTDDRAAPGYVFAGAIYSPSYVSFETALQIHGLIGPQKAVFYSATKDKDKHKNYVNDLGEFFYQDIPNDVFHQGTIYLKDSGYLFLVAGKEKAICDTLYKANSLTSIKKLKDFLFKELGLNEDVFWGLNTDQILQFCPLYKSRSLHNLELMIRKRLGLPVAAKAKKKASEKDSAQEAWDALAAFRNKYQD